MLDFISLSELSALGSVIIIGLVLAGGVLLLWVAWKLWREVESQRRHRRAGLGAVDGPGGGAEGPTLAEPEVAPKSFRAAVTQIIVADVTMSLDNVLGVAGAAREHFWVLVVGLILSIGFMGVAASAIASLLNRYHWIAYVGIVVIAYVAGLMIWEGSVAVIDAIREAG